jgi:hypothetical protein
MAALNVTKDTSTGGTDEDATARRNEQRRKRYREAKVEDSTGKGGLGLDMDDEKPAKKSQSHESQLAARREKDRQRYSNMSGGQRQVYNAKRREQYHRQSENSRVKRRERERSRYHSLNNDMAKDRNSRRARLERERYQRLSSDELESKNRKRRERAATARQRKEAAAAAGTLPRSSSCSSSCCAYCCYLIVWLDTKHIDTAHCLLTHLHISPSLLQLSPPLPWAIFFLRNQMLLIHPKTTQSWKLKQHLRLRRTSSLSRQLTRLYLDWNKLAWENRYLYYACMD